MQENIEKKVKDCRREDIHPLLVIISSVVTFFLGLLFVKQTFFSLFLLSLLMVFFLFGYRREIFRISIIFIPIAVFIGALSLINGNLTNAKESFFRFYVMGLSSTMVIAMKPISLVRFLNQKKVPRWVTIALLIAMRFLGVLREELKLIKRAIYLRGIRFMENPMLYLRAFLLPMMIRIMCISEILSTSLETRGFTLDKEASVYEYVYFRKRDAVFSVLFFGMFAFFCYVTFVY